MTFYPGAKLYAYAKDLEEEKWIKTEFTFDTKNKVILIIRSMRYPTRSTGCPTRSTGCPTRSTGCPTRSTGCPTR